MAQASHIEWTETTWNPVVGCSKVSAGCKNCYAERMAKRLAAMARAAAARGQNAGRTGHYLQVINGAGRWNGHVFLDWSALDDPLGWSGSRYVFVNSMSDLFHEEVPLPFVQRAFRTMNRCANHTFQILTKRPHVAAEYSRFLDWTPNIWMGTSVENAAVTHRIEDLIRTHAWIKFLSIEPLLGRIRKLPLEEVDWVIVGGESGPGSRTMRAEWVREIRDACLDNDVHFFFKQWGGVNKKRSGRLLDEQTWDDRPPLPDENWSLSLAS